MLTVQLSDHKEHESIHLAFSGVYSWPVGVCLLALAHSERLGQPASCVGFRIAHPFKENPKLEPSLGFVLGGFRLCHCPRATFSSPSPSPSLVLLRSATLRALLMFYAAVAFPLDSHPAMGFLQFWGGEAKKLGAWDGCRRTALAICSLIPFTLWVGSARPAKLACLTSGLG